MFQAEGRGLNQGYVRGSGHRLSESAGHPPAGNIALASLSSPGSLDAEQCQHQGGEQNADKLEASHIDHGGGMKRELVAVWSVLADAGTARARLQMAHRKPARATCHISGACNGSVLRTPQVTGSVEHFRMKWITCRKSACAEDCGWGCPYSEGCWGPASGGGQERRNTTQCVATVHR